MSSGRAVVISILVSAVLLVAGLVVLERSVTGRSGAAPTATSRVISSTPARSLDPAGSPPHSAKKPKDTNDMSATHGPFSLVIRMRSADISAHVGSISVASNEPVDPPHKTAREWDTAVWVRQSSYPSRTAAGTSYIYGHACHHHVCPFTDLKDAQVGDVAIVRTASETLKYRIVRIGLSPKTARSLPSWAADSRVPQRLVLVTCAFERNDVSTDNIVAVAERIA